jgi:hypothetical protein
MRQTQDVESVVNLDWAINFNKANRYLNDITTY